MKILNNLSKKNRRLNFKKMMPIQRPFRIQKNIKENLKDKKKKIRF